MLPERVSAEAFRSQLRAKPGTSGRIPALERRTQDHYMRDLFSLAGVKWSSVLYNIKSTGTV
jgi:hypothetical protein